jgi:hypothetical protein
LEPFFRVFTPEWLEEKSINAYYFAFLAVVDGVAREQQKLGLTEQVDFVFDEQVMEQDKIAKGWESFKGLAKPEIRTRIGNFPYFLDDVKFKPLQAADLIAWWVRKLHTNEPDRVPRTEIPWKSSRQLPSFQFHYDEARLIAVRDATIAAVASREDKPL